MPKYDQGSLWTPARSIQAIGRAIRVQREPKARMFKRDGFWCLECPSTHVEITGLAPQYVYADYLEVLANRTRIY